jgi:hypothetical protein
VSAEPIDDGGPAYPFGQISELTGQPINGYFSAGQSYRADVAKECLAAIVGRPCMLSPIPDDAADEAVKYADALIRRLKGGAE